MNKDFPSASFEVPEKTNKRPNLNEYRDLYAERDNLTNLTYSHPVTVSYDDINNVPKVLTQQFFSSDHLKQTSSLLPWNLPCDLRKYRGYDIYNEIVNKSNTIHSNYYLAWCKSTRAKFYPDLLNKASHGKCFLTNDNIWLTPIEFQAYSGSTRSDWKASIILYHPSTDNRLSRKRKKKDNLTVKKLVDNKIVKMHSYNCDCSSCSNSANFQSENINLLSCFFMNNGEDLVMLHPNISHQNQIDINIYKTQTDLKNASIADVLIPVNSDNLKNDPNYKNNKKSINFNTDDDPNLIINQIQCETFDDEANYFNSKKVAQNVKQAFISLNLSNSKVQTFQLQLNDEYDEEYFDTKLLYEVKTNSDYISSISSSHLIQGECAVLLEKSGDIHLLSDEQRLSKYFEDQSSLKIANGLQPTFYSKSKWKNVNFGAQPRQFIYSDHSQVLSIDSRIKSIGNNINREIFKLSDKYVEIDELISRTQIAENDYYYHLICCSKTFLIIDERYTKSPMLSMKHNLKSSALFLDNLFLPSADHSQDYTHLAILSDSAENYAYQFSVKNGMFLSHNFPRKLESPNDMISYMPNSYDKRLANHLKYRLSEPVIGFSSLRYSNSFALFQLLPSFDLFYECFEINDNCKQNELSLNWQMYEDWTSELQNQILTDFNLSLESDFNDMSIGSNKERKKTHFLEKYTEMCSKSKEELNKHLHLNKASKSNIKNQQIFKFQDIDLNQNELTGSLYEIWDANLNI